MECARLASTGDGGSVVYIDGDVGMGKSHLMQHIWTKCQSEKALESVWASGDPFSVLKPFFVWRQIFAAIFHNFNETSEERQEWFLALIKDEHPSLLPHISLINEIFQCEFDATASGNSSNFAYSAESPVANEGPKRKMTLVLNPRALDESLDAQAQRQSQPQTASSSINSVQYQEAQAKLTLNQDVIAQLCIVYLQTLFAPPASAKQQPQLPAAPDSWQHNTSDTTSSSCIANSRAAAARVGLVMFFDRSLHMSSSDWHLLDRVCAMVKSRELRRITVVVGCRSQHKMHISSTETEAVPLELHNRLRLQHATHTLSLRALSSSGTAQMVAYIVNGQYGVNSTLVHERTGGTVSVSFALAAFPFQHCNLLTA